jgi:hypothetical protein
MGVDMGEFRVQVNTDNAAFEEPGFELARILREVADRLESGSVAGNVRDINGNSVGSFELD